MPNVSHFNVQGQVIDVKDTTARNTANDALNTAKNADAISKRLTNKRLVIIGDSYGLGINASTNYPEVLKNVLSLPDDSIFNLSQSGARFSSTTGGTTYNACLNEGYTKVTNPDTITDVIVAGGINDAMHYSDAQGTIWTDAATLMTNIKSKFPNAKIIGAFIGYRVNRQILSEISNMSRTWSEIFPAYGGAYNGDLQWICHDQANLGDDKLHPSDLGQKYLAFGLASVLLYGSYTYISNDKNIICTASGVGTGNLRIYMRQVNSSVTVCFGNSYIDTTNDSSRDHNGTDLIQIASIPDSVSCICGNQDTNFSKISVPGYAITSDNKVLFGLLSIVVANNTIFLQDYIYSGTGNATFNGKIKGFRIPALSTTLSCINN